MSVRKWYCEAVLYCETLAEFGTPVNPPCWRGTAPECGRIRLLIMAGAEHIFEQNVA